MNEDINSKRLKDLEDNIRKDQKLLKNYEDELRYESDPSRRANYSRQIERLRESLTRNQQEYDKLHTNNIDEQLKAILENTRVLFIGEEVSERSGVPNFGDFIIEIIELITKHELGDANFDELRKNIRSESAFKILHDEIGDDILICFEEFNKYEHNQIHDYIANEIKKGKCIFTTNRDNLIEKACERCGVHLDQDKLIYQDNKFKKFYKNIQSHQPLPVGHIFMLNGYFDKNEEGKERFRPFLDSLKGVGKDLNTNKLEVLIHFLKNFDFCFMGYTGFDDSSIYQVLKNVHTEKGMFWFNYAKNPIEIISTNEHLEDEIKNEIKKKRGRSRDIKTLYLNKILLKRKFFLKITGNWIEFVQNNLCPALDITRSADLPPVKKKDYSTELLKLREKIDGYKKNIIHGRLWEECLSKEKAIMCFEDAEKLREGKNNARAKLSLARVYDKQYGKSKAEIVIKKYQESCEIYKAHGIFSEAAQCKIGLANFQRRALKQFDAALNEYEQAKKLLELVENKGEIYKLAYARCLSCRGLIYYSKLGSKSIDKCDILFKESLKCSKEIGDIKGEAETENAIGLNIRNKKDIDTERAIHHLEEAIHHLVNSLVINESIGNYIGAIKNYRNLGLCYTDLINLVEDEEAKEKNFQQAKESYESGIYFWYIMKGEPPVEGISEYKYRLGELEVNDGDINEGITLLQEVEEKWYKIGDWHNRARSLDLLRKAYNKHEYTDSKGTEDLKSTIDKIIDIYKNVLDDDNKLKQMKENKIIFDNAVQILDRTKETIKDIILKDKHIIALRKSESKAEDVENILKKLREFMGETRTKEFVGRNTEQEIQKEKQSEASRKEGDRGASVKYDVFICHASEDKDAIVSELAQKLSNKGLMVWYDDFTLSLGDSLRRSIDDGLAKSRYGVVVLSEKFFEKAWPQKELNGLVARENERGKVILPIWHNVTKEQVTSFSSMLADRKAASTDKGVNYVINEILKVVSPRKADQNEITNDIKEPGGADLGEVEEIARDSAKGKLGLNKIQISKTKDENGIYKVEGNGVSSSGVLKYFSIRIDAKTKKLKDYEVEDNPWSITPIR